MLMEEQGLDTIVLRKLEMEDKPKDMQGWHDMVARILKNMTKGNYCCSRQICCFAGCLYFYYRILASCSSCQ